MKLIAGDVVRIDNGTQEARGEIIDFNESRVWVRMEDGVSRQFRMVERRGGCLVLTQDTVADEVLYLVEERHSGHYKKALL